MDPVHVPRPPQSSFNKNRPISDLIKAQIKHFQHLEAKLPPQDRSPLAAHELTTESAAAQYIAHMTSVLCRLGSEARKGQRAKPRVIARRSPAPIWPSTAGLSLAAAAGESGGNSEKRTAGKSSKNVGSARRRGRRAREHHEVCLSATPSCCLHGYLPMRPRPE